MTYGTITTTEYNGYEIVHGHQSKGRRNCTIYDKDGNVVRVGGFSNEKEMLDKAKTTIDNINAGKETADAQYW